MASELFIEIRVEPIVVIEGETEDLTIVEYSDERSITLLPYLETKADVEEDEGTLGG